MSVTRPTSIHACRPFNKSNLARHRVVLGVTERGPNIIAGILWERVFPTTELLTKWLVRELKLASPEVA